MLTSRSFPARALRCPLGIAATLALGVAPALAQVTEAWVARYDGAISREDYARSLAIDRFGNVYVTGGEQNDPDDRGAQQDYSTVKYDSNGNELWVAHYSYESWPTPSDDLPRSIVVDGSDNVYVTGQSLRYDPEDWSGTQVNYDVATIKYDKYGNQVWVRRWNGTGDWWDSASDMAIDSAGNLYIAIESDYEGKPYIGPWEAAVIKYDTDGNLLWDVRERSMTGGPRLKLDAQANVYVASTGGSGAAVAKYDTNGNRLWFTLGPVGAGVTKLAVDNQGNAYVTGAKSGDIWTAKYDGANGNRLWTDSFAGDAGSSDEEGTGVGVDSNGNVFVAGYAVWTGASQDWAILKYNSAGSLLWGRRYNGPDNKNDYAMDLAMDGPGNVYVTGFIAVPVSGPWAGPFDYLTLKADTDGTLLWEMTYDYGVEGRDTPHHIRLDNAGNVYVTGLSAQYAPAADYDFTTIKYVQDFVCQPCDTNCDGTANTFDINDFIAVLSGGAGCSPCAGDSNGDGTANTFDINGFIACLGG